MKRYGVFKEDKKVKEFMMHSSFLELIIQNKLSALLVPASYIGIYGYRVGSIVKICSENNYIFVQLLDIKHHFDFAGAFYSQGSCIAPNNSVVEFVHYFNINFHYSDENIDDFPDKYTSRYIRDMGGCFSMSFKVLEIGPHDIISIIDEQFIQSY